MGWAVFGQRKGADLVYASKVDLGFDRENAKALRARLTPLIRDTQPTASA
jgi:bifunctional non-homologous end joining protein LigD